LPCADAPGIRRPGRGRPSHGPDGFRPTLQLAVDQTNATIVFAFRGDNRRTSAATLALPDTISIFEVDPRGVADRARGRDCTEASEFTDWTLTLHGTAGTLYGALTSAAR